MKHFKKISTFGLMLMLFMGLTLTASHAQMGDMPETHKLSGKVVNADNGKALPNIEVDIAQTRFSKETGTDGSYTFSRLPEGTHTVTVKAEGYKSWKKDVTLDEDTRLKIKLTPAK